MHRLKPLDTYLGIHANPGSKSQYSIILDVQLTPTSAISHERRVWSRSRYKNRSRQRNGGALFVQLWTICFLVGRR